MFHQFTSNTLNVPNLIFSIMITNIIFLSKAMNWHLGACKAKAATSQTQRNRETHIYCGMQGENRSFSKVMPSETQRKHEVGP